MFYRVGSNYKSLYEPTVNSGYRSNKTSIDSHYADRGGHDGEQKDGAGKFFDWKGYISDNVGSVFDAQGNRLTDPAPDAKFWDRALWGATSYSTNFTTEEKTYGMPGIKLNEARSLLSGDSGLTTDYNGMANVTSARIFNFNFNAATYDSRRTDSVYDYIGGVAGYATSIRSIAVLDSFIYAPRSSFVGGMAGRVSAADSNYSSNTGNIGIMVGNTHVVGGSQVGGVYGDTYRYTTQAVLVDQNTLVEGRNIPVLTSRNGNDVGGIAGRVQMTSTTIESDHPTFKYILSAATVVGCSNVGGLIGYYNHDFYTDTSDTGWAMLGKVIVNGTDRGNGDLVLNQISTHLKYYNKGVILSASSLSAYNDPILVGNPDCQLDISKSDTSKITAAAYLNSLSPTYAARLDIVNYSDLSNKTVYTDKLGWPGATPASGNYTTNKFLYDKLSAGYLPHLTMESSIQNNFTQGSAAMYPRRTILLELPSDRAVTNSGSGGNSNGGGLVDFSGIPQATIYASGVDMVSIDFSRVDPSYTWTLSLGDRVVSGVVDKKTICFTYDFASDITVVVSGDEGEITTAATGSELAHYVSAAGGEYYILASDGIRRGTGSNLLTTRYGTYVNLFDGNALELDGSVIDLETGTVTGATERGTALGDERSPKPLSFGEFGEYKVETFATYSKTTDLNTGEETIREGFLFYTDGKSLQSIRTSQNVKADSVILWSDLENTYFAALGKDRKVAVLLDGGFKVPESISSEGIYEMSSSRELRAPYCIVRYTNGGICAFNFVTGEVLYEEAAPQGLSSGGGDASSGNSALSFSRAMELTDALKSGAVNLNGIVRKSPVSRNEASEQAVVDGEYLDGEGNVIGTNEADFMIGENVDGESTVVGEEFVDGSPIQTDESETRAEAGGASGIIGGESDAKPLEEQPELSEDEGGSSGEGIFGKTSAIDENAVGENDDMSILPEMGSEGNIGGNTLNGSNDQNGEEGEDGLINLPNIGNSNVQLGTMVSQTSFEGVDPKLLSSVESEAAALIEDGSIQLETITEVLNISEVEAKTTLCDTAVQLVEGSDSYSIREAIAKALKDIVLNPTNYMKEPEVYKPAEDYSSVAAYNLQTIKDALGGVDSVDPSTLRFIPVLNPDTGEYELFEMDELLTGKDEQVKSIEERLAESGRFINTAHGFRSGADESKAARDYKGFIAVVVAIILAGGLTCALIYKKRKEGSR